MIGTGSKTHGRLVDVSTLEERDILAMLALMRGHYENVDEDRFRADIVQKRWAILVHDTVSGTLCGFSTQTVWHHAVGQQQTIVLFSGDTIIARPYWGDSTLGSIWGQLAVSLIESHPKMPCYWFLISQGFRTYRYLPLFFHEFYPRYDRITPADVTTLIAELGLRCGGERYNRETQVISCADSHYRLRAELEMPIERQADPHLAWFRRLNPRHDRGDELCCLAPLHRDNFTSAAWRWIRRSQPIMAS